MNEDKADTRIPRTMMIGINVDSADRLPRVGRQLAAFLKSIDHDHGPFDVKLAVAVEPTKESEIEPFEFPDNTDGLTERPVEVFLISGDDDMHTEGAD